MGYALLITLVLLGLVRASLLTAPVRNWVKDKVTEQAESYLNGQLQINSILGDLGSDWSATGISILNSNGDSLASMDTLHVRYNLWALWKQQVEITEMDVIGPHLAINKDSTGWNWDRIVKPDTSIDEPSSPNPWSIQIRRWMLRDGNTDLLLDSDIKPNQWQLKHINAEGSAGYVSEEPRFKLNSLRVQVHTPGLRNQPMIDVSGEGGFEGQTFTLDQLLLGVGASALQARGIYMMGADSIAADLNAEPLTWQSVSQFAQQVPVNNQSSSRFNLEVRGKWPELGMTLEAQTTGLDSATIAVDGRWDSTLTLNQINLGFWNLDATQLLDSSLVIPLKVNKATAAWQGRLPLLDVNTGSGKASYRFDGVRYDTYRLQHINGGFDLERGNVQMRMAAFRKQEKIRITARSNNALNQTDAQWDAKATFENVDPKYWAQETLDVQPLNGSVNVRGRGYSWTNRPVHYRIDLDRPNINNQPFRSIALAGSITDQVVRGKGALQLKESQVTYNVNSRYNDDLPTFDFEAHSKNLNLAEITGVTGLDTQLRMKLYGQGAGVDFSTLRLNSNISLDSSIVNNERIETFRGQVSVRDTVLHLSEGRIQSPIADGELSLRQHLLRPTDIQNSLSMDLQVKDIRPLAPVLGTDVLEAKGQVVGSIFPEVDETLEFEASVDLSGVRYTSDYKAESVEGRIHYSIVEEPSYFLSLLIKQPEYNEYQFQDLEISTSGTAHLDRTQGEARILFRKGKNSQLRQHLSYTAMTDTTQFQITEMSITDPARTLYLKKPVSGFVLNEAVRMDTLVLESPDAVRLTLALPYVGSERQQMYVAGNGIDLGVLQEIVIGEPLIQGKMDGQLAFNYQADDLDMQSQIQFRDLVYEDVKLDSLRIFGGITNRVLDVGLTGSMKGRKALLANLRGPIILPSDNSARADSLAQLPLKGLFKVEPIAMGELKPWLTAAGWENTSGKVQFNGILKGTVRNPQFEGTGMLRNGALSGVRVDSMAVDLGYDHQQAEFKFASSIFSLRQRAMELNGNVPFKLDLEKHEVRLPSEQDPIFVELYTNKFQLAALNDFVDRSMIRNLKGQLDGLIKVSGTYGQPAANGQLTLSNGSMSVVQAGIKVSELQTQVVIEKDSLWVKRGRMRSGNGSAELRGYIALNDLVPGKSDLKLTMRNFRAANTRDYNAIISSEARLTGTLWKPTVSGDLTVQNGFIYMRNFGEKSVESVDLREFEASEGYQIDLYDSLALDMNISFNRGFYVRNRRYLDMEVELNGGIDVQKQIGDELTLFGSLGAASGYARPLGKQFNIETGQITFSGDPYNPLLNIRTLYQPPRPEGTGDVKIWYIIEGRVDNPKFRYESEPHMELENIISYTLFGKPYYALQSWEQVVTNTGADQSQANVALDVLLDQVESLATRRLGIDVVRIDNNTSASGAGTTIKTGWYINEKVFFAVLNEINGTTPNTSFIIEYMLSKNLDLILQQGDNNRTGVDIRWQYDY